MFVGGALQRTCPIDVIDAGTSMNNELFNEGDKVVTTDGTHYTIRRVEKRNDDLPQMSRYTVANADRVIENYPGYLLQRAEQQ